MAESTPRAMFGNHDVTLFDNTTFLPFGRFRVLGTLSFENTFDLVDLNGGSNSFPWNTGRGLTSSEISLEIRELHDIMFSKFLGATVTSTAAEAGGNVSVLTDKVGTSITDGSTGLIIGIISGSEADVKDNYYVIKAVSATTIDVYAYTGTDFFTGTVGSFDGDGLKLNATPLDVSSTAQLTGYGLEFTLAGVTALVVDDTAWTESRKINTGSSQIVVGQAGSVIPEIGMHISSERQGGGATARTLIHRAIASGFPMSWNEKDWAGNTVTAKALYCPSANAVWTQDFTDNDAAC